MMIPPLILGTMYYGTRIPATDSFRMIDQYLASGMTMLDTANNYAFWVNGSQGGESESVIGDWLEQTGRRNDVLIATKIGARPIRPGGDLAETEGIRPATIRAAIEGSLRRMRIDAVDLLYLHIDQPNVPLEPVIATLGALVDEGKARAIGLSNFTEDRLRDAITLAQSSIPGGIAAVQMRHSVIPPRADADFGVQQVATPEILALLADASIPLVAYSPLLEGALAGEDRPLPQDYATPSNEKRVLALQRSARDHGRTLPQEVLDIVLADGHRALIGARTPEQLADSIAVATGLRQASRRSTDEVRK